MKYVLLFSFLCLFVPKASAEMVAVNESARLEKVFQTGKFSDDTIKALDNMMYAAAVKLRDRGYNDDADQLSSEWAHHYRGVMLSHRMQDIGDHAPVIWLYATWKKLDDLLGREIMVFTHLDDLWEFAFTIPVVFQCENNVDASEYKKHFVVFSGAVSYWTAMGVCAVAAIGTPYSLICSPVGDVCEAIMERIIAPRISDRVWGKICQ